MNISLLKALRIAAKTDNPNKEISAGVQDPNSGEVSVTFRQGQRRLTTTMTEQTMSPTTKYVTSELTLPGHTLVD
jgi:hypothetical protein